MRSDFKKSPLRVSQKIRSRSSQQLLTLWSRNYLHLWLVLTQADYKHVGFSHPDESDDKQTVPRIWVSTHNWFVFNPSEKVQALSVKDRQDVSPRKGGMPLRTT